MLVIGWRDGREVRPTENVEHTKRGDGKVQWDFPFVCLAHMLWWDLGGARTFYLFEDPNTKQRLLDNVYSPYPTPDLAKVSRGSDQS